MRDIIRCAFVALVVLCSIRPGHAIPPMINYQGVLLDGSSNPVTTPTNVLFAIWNQSAAGDSLWSVSRSVTPDASGAFTVLLGEVNAVPDSIFALDNVFLSLKVGTDAEMSPRHQIVSAGYAYRVGTVDGASGGTISGDVSIQSDLDLDGDLRITGKATLGGSNTNTGGQSFVAGASNTVSDLGSVVSGGVLNTSTGPQSTVSGGFNNTASALRATVSGGSYNRARGEYSSVGGGGGGTDVDSNSANANWATVAGGRGNSAGGTYGTIGGGVGNGVTGDRNTIAGGSANAADGTFGAVAGGAFNTSSGVASAIGGGLSNSADADSATISGGGANSATGISSTVGGGVRNEASGLGSFVGGGQGNTSSSESTVIGGGTSNTANAPASTVAGGSSNQASGANAAVGGGVQNTASGLSSVVPGGMSNTAAGLYSCAAGRRAKANHDGAFVWGDSFDGDVASSAVDQFTVRASGGVRFFSNSSLTTGVTLAAGGGAWASVSDRKVKQNIRPVDGNELLEKIAELDISRWNYESQDPSIEHIGPMAQDFYRLFGVGDNDKTITTVDPDGIALAAIKELAARNAQLESTLARQQQQIETMCAMIESLTNRQ